MFSKLAINSQSNANSVAVDVGMRCTYSSLQPLRNRAQNGAKYPTMRAAWQDREFPVDRRSTAHDTSGHRLAVSVGFCSETGQRAANEDYVGCAQLERAGSDVVAAIADGVGGHKGGRGAAGLAGRGV